MSPNSRRLKVLFLPHPPELREPWLHDVRELIGDRHELRVYDEQLPLPPQIQDVEVVVDHGGGHSTREMADLGSSVKLWQILGTGFDHFDVEYWRRKGFPVANTPGQFSAPALAECAMMFILMMSRRWHVAEAKFQQRQFHEPMHYELEGRRLLLIGFGASARELAARAIPFGMKISAVDIREVPETEKQQFHLDTVVKPEQMDGLIPECDYLSLHLHLNASTKSILDDRRLRLMKHGAYLVNVARGALVDEPALYRALADGRLAGAGLDVFGTEPPDPNNPLFKLPNVFAAPHFAGMTDGTSRRRASCAVQNIDRIAQGLEPLYRVDTIG